MKKESQVQVQVQVQTALRLPVSTIGQADRLAAKLSRPGLRVTRADVLRMALTQGLAHMGKEKAR